MPTKREQPGYAQALHAARYLRGRSGQFPEVGIVLGSGLGALAAELTDPHTISYLRIPHFPQPAVEGHTGRLHLGRWGDLPLKWFLPCARWAWRVFELSFLPAPRGALRPRLLRAA